MRPLIVEALIAYYKWAQHDLQHKDATHPDLPYVVGRLRQLLDERYTRPNIIRTAWQWF